MYYIQNDISQTILTIGPDYHNHKGGIGSVIEIYSKYFQNFKFLASFKEGSSFYKSLFFIRSIFRLFQLLIIDHKIKIVHIHGASYGSFFRKFVCFVIAKYIFQKKIIYHIHGAEYQLFYFHSNKFIKKLIKSFINNADLIICLSTAWKTFFKLNFNPKNIEIVPNIIDYPSLSNSKKDDTILILLFLGMIGQRKGIFDLLEVISNNKGKYIGKIKLVIGGNGEVERLSNIIRDKRLEDLIEFVGWITDEKKIAWLQKANIYILPSYNEGLPISILEALSYGQSIIASNVGGISEIVFPYINGILIEPGNLSEIESAINFFIKNPEVMKIYGAESIQVSKKYFPESVVSELSEIFKSLLKNEQTFSQEYSR